VDINPSAGINSNSRSKLTQTGSTADSFLRIHRDALSDLAGNMRIPVDQVRKLYSIILDKLSKEARIRDYLSILATKKVKDLMQKRLEIKSKLGGAGCMAQSAISTLDKQREN